MLIELGGLLAGIVLAAIAIHRVAPPPSPTRQPTRTSEAPEQLGRAARALALCSTAGDLHLRLRPLLRAVATERLHSHGADLDDAGPHARALLGESLWELVRPDRPPPDDAFARGVTAAQVDAMLDRLESL